MKLNNNFANKLNELRIERNLTGQELAKLAGVSQPLISGLLNNNRTIGELTARKIGMALRLQGKELEDFIYLAINGCTEKVLNSSRKYPAEVLNLIAGELNALGILPDKITGCVRHPGNDADTALYLNDGKWAFINVEVALR